MKQSDEAPASPAYTDPEADRPAFFDGAAAARHAEALAVPRVCNNVIEAIGATPLIRLGRFIGEGPRCYLKFEAMNPGGSSKDRSAREMLLAAEREQGLKPGSKVIISTSGNMGIGLAMICAYKGYELVAIVDPKISPTNESILRVYGAQIVKVTEKDEHGGYHLTRLKKADELKARYPDAAYIDQYDNKYNALAHYRTTAPEIHRALGGDVAAIVVAAGTGGTLMGTARYFKEHVPGVQIWAVDEHGSLALPANNIPQPRYLNGMGTSQRPANYDYPNLHKYLDAQRYVNATEAIRAAILLARTEGILVGGSGGAVAHVMRHVMRKAYGPNQNIVGIIPDHGSRYTNDFFNDEWLAARDIPISIEDDVGDE